MAVRSDRGQTTSAYLGMMLVAASIVVGVTTQTDVPYRISTGLDAAVCTVITHERCETEDAAASSDPDRPNEPAGTEETPELTPEERAESGRYVAIGDSFTSGEGARDYEEGSDTETNRCHRSDNSYARRLEQEHGFRGGTTVVSCSGAKADDVLESGQHGEPAQIEAIWPDASLVTIGITGNDADWVPVLMTCWTSEPDGCLAQEDEVRQRIDAAADKAFEVYLEARERAGPDARIIAIGYPRFFPEDGTDAQYELALGCVSIPLAGTKCAKRWSISTEEQRWMNELTAYFNQRLADRAREAGIEFLDMTAAFDGHELGTGDSYFNGVELGQRVPGCDDWKNPRCYVHPETFHPNAWGHERFAELIEEQIENPR